MKDLTTGHEGRIILKFALPMLAGNVFQQLYNVVDSIVIGHFVGKEALAAVGAAFPLIFVLVAFVIGIGMGFSIVLSQFFGAKKTGQVIQTIDTMWVFLFWAGLFITIAGILLSRPILRLTGLPEEVLPMAVEYLHIYLAGTLLFFGFNGMTSVLRGLGDSKTPLYFLILSTFINIGLDLLFVVVFGWGIRGVAFATVIAQGGAFFTMVFWLNRYHKLVELRWRLYSFNREIFRKSLSIGLPTGFQQTFVSLGMIAIFSIVNRFGTNAVAAFSAAGRIDSFAMMPAMNFAAALSSFAGQNIGAGKQDRVRKGMWATMYMTLAVSVAFTLLAWTGGRQLMMIFTTDARVIEIGVEYLRIVSSFYIFFSAMFTLNGVMRGAGDTLIPMFITLLSLWLVRIPLSYGLSEVFGTTGIWWGIPLAWFSGASFTYIFFLKGK